MGVISDYQLNIIKSQMVPIFGGTGREGKVFKYNDLAVKFFKYPVYQHQEDGYDFLMGLKANNFVLIKDKFYEDNMMKGFTMDYLEDKLDSIDDIRMSSLISDFKLIKQDLSMFLDNKVILVDLHRKNVMFDGNLHIIDTNAYLPLSVYTELNDETLTEEQTKEQIRSDNLIQVNNATIDFIANRLSDEFTFVEKNEFKQKILKDIRFSSYDYIGDFLQEETNNCLLKDYVKKKL